MLRYVLLCFLIIYSFSVIAQEEHQPFLYGHNLTATSDVLSSGQVILGFDISALGITDTLTIGSSPWMWTDYNMSSIAVRKQIQNDEVGDWAVQIDYFKTFGERDHENLKYFKMESLWNVLIRTWEVSSSYRLHTNFQVNYYWNQTLPFSLRRPSENKTPWQVNISSLHEVKLMGPWIASFEAGLMDIARQPMYAHGGASIGQSWQHFSWHFGFSLDVTSSSAFNPSRSDYQYDLHWSKANGYNDKLDEQLLEKDYALHQEFSLQIAF